MRGNDDTADCLLCRKQRGEVPIPGGWIYENEFLTVCHMSYPTSGPDQIYPGYLLIENKRHVPGLAELTDEEAQAIGPRLARALKECEGVEHMYEFVFGHDVPHLHIHLVPRYPGTPREYWRMRVDEWPAAPHGGQPEIEALCERLRASLRNEA
jgi:histidine triad (HIT) family protein